MGDTAEGAVEIRHDVRGDKPSSVTENEEAFKGPKFDPPVYRRRYAAVCELVKKYQAKKVLDHETCFKNILEMVRGLYGYTYLLYILAS